MYSVEQNTGYTTVAVEKNSITKNAIFSSKGAKWRAARRPRIQGVNYLWEWSKKY